MYSVLGTILHSEIQNIRVSFNILSNSIQAKTRQANSSTMQNPHNLLICNRRSDIRAHALIHTEIEELKNTQIHIDITILIDGKRKGRVYVVFYECK